MPEHFTAPPPYARYGGRVPDCRSLPNAITEAEEYLNRAKGWMKEAEDAEARANGLVSDLRGVVESARQALNAAAALANKAKPGTPSFDAKVADRDKAHDIYKNADADLKRAEDEAYARTRDRQALAEEVRKSESWLRQLSLLAACPEPVTPTPVAPPVDGGNPFPPPTAPLGGPPNCSNLEEQLENAKKLKAALESDISDLFWDIDEAQDEWDAAQKSLRDAERKFEAAQKAFDAVPKSHDAYWDHLNADGSPAIQYRPNKQYEAAKKTRDDAMRDVQQARANADAARRTLDALVQRRIQDQRELEKVIARIRELEIMLELCRTGIAVAPDAPEPKTTKATFLVGMSAFAVAALSMIAVLLGGRGHDPAPEPTPVRTSSTTVERPASPVTPTSVVVTPATTVIEQPPATAEPSAPSEPIHVPSTRPVITPEEPATNTTVPAPAPPPPPTSTTEPPRTQEPPATTEPPTTTTPPPTESEPPTVTEPPSSSGEIDTVVGPPVITFGGSGGTDTAGVSEPVSGPVEAPNVEPLG